MADDKEEKKEEAQKSPEPQETSQDVGGMEKTDEKPVNIGLLEEIQKSQGKRLENVKIYSPFQVYFDGQAESVSAVNLTGPFDILPGHKNFMTLLTAGEIVVRSKRGAEKLKIERGVMHVRKNKVEIFLDV